MGIESISILAIPRTGTNYLCGLMGRFKEIDSLYEIYHHQAVYMGNKSLASNVIKHINYKYQLKIKDCSDSIFIDFVAQNPQEILQIIHQQSQHKYISFKIFPNHLSPQCLTKAIIKNNRIKKILVKRNLLDAYLSFKFAQMTKTWRDRDTSNLKLRFEEDNFISWVTSAQNYYDFVESQSNNIESEIAIINHEEIHGFKSDRNKFFFLFYFLRSIGLELNEDNLSNNQLKKLSNLRNKQDNRTNVLDKVINPQTLLDVLKNNQLEYLLS